MALNDSGLFDALLALMTKTSPSTPEAAAAALRDAIKAYVKSGTVSGSVSVTNSLVAGPYPVTGASSGNMSSGSIS